MNAMASQITSLSIVYSTVYLGADQIKRQSSASLAFVRGIHRWPVNTPHKGPVTRKMFPFQDSRFKMALLLPIKHRIIYITVISTWNVNTSTNTAMHYHGSKGSWKSCGIYGLLVCYTYSKYISTGVQRVQQKKTKNKKVTQNDIASNYVSTTHAVHNFN